MPVNITYYYGIMREHLDAEPRCYIVEEYFFGELCQDGALIDTCELSTLRPEDALLVADAWCEDRETCESYGPRVTMLDPGVYYGYRPPYTPKQGAARNAEMRSLLGAIS